MPKLKEEWWHTMPDGRKVGWMLSWEFENWIAAMYQEGATPRVQFAHDMGIDVSKVHRWITGKDPIPKWVAQMYLMRKESGFGFGRSDKMASWLPYSESVNGKRHPPQQNTVEQRGKTPKKAA